MRMIIAAAAALVLSGSAALAQDVSGEPINCDPANTSAQYSFYGVIRVGGQGNPNINGRYTKNMLHPSEDCSAVQNDQGAVLEFPPPDITDFYIGVFSLSSRLWKWVGTGCISFGFGQGLTTAVQSMISAGCSGGQFCKIGGDGACYDFPY